MKKLILTNFQSHQHTELNLHPAMNCIIGPSDSGKSAIIRAIKWIVFNRPSGNAFVRSGMDGSIVDIDDITRIKGEGVNSYFTGEEKFTAFGASVPEEVTEALNISEINFQHQLDPHFLLTQSAGEVAKMLNEIVDLNVIDRAFKNIGKLERENKHQIMDCNGNIHRAEESIKEFDWIKEAEKLTEILSIIETEILDIEKEVTELKDTVQYVKSAENALESHKNLDVLDHMLQEIIDSGAEIDNIRADYEKLEELAVEIARKELKAERLADQIEELETELADSMPDICPLCGAET